MRTRLIPAWTWGLLLTFGCGLLLSACGAERELTADEVRDALAGLPFEVELDESRSSDDLIIGTAADEKGISMDFAIAVDGAGIPKDLVNELGVTGYSTWDTGWEQAYGIDPGVTVDDIQHPSRQPPAPPVRVTKAREEMSLEIENAMCEHVECPFP